MEDKSISLQDELVKIFAKAVKDVFDREKNDSKYMNQTFLGVRYRAYKGIKAIVKKAFKDMYKLLALSIASHRTKEHGEDKTWTIKTLSRSMSAEAVSVGTRSYWNPWKK